MESLVTPEQEKEIDDLVAQIDKIQLSDEAKGHIFLGVALAYFDKAGKLPPQFSQFKPGEKPEEG